MADGQAQETADQGYGRPIVVDYGDLVDLTAGAAHGSHQDATFPTPTTHTTFSG